MTSCSKQLMQCTINGFVTLSVHLPSPPLLIPVFFLCVSSLQSIALAEIASQRGIDLRDLQLKAITWHDLREDVLVLAATGSGRVFSFSQLLSYPV
jgi:superfamily II RNA helicase